MDKMIFTCDLFVIIKLMIVYQFFFTQLNNISTYIKANKKVTG